MEIGYESLSCDLYREAAISRRKLLTGGLLAGLAGLAPSALSQVSVAGKQGRTRDHSVVVIFLRGGADGLNIVTPYGEDGYYRARPGLGLAKGDLHKVGDLFGLNPALKPLFQRYDDGELAFVHACGSQDKTRSHFEAMSTMERGLAAEGGAASGWIARYLSATSSASNSPLRAVSIASVAPDSLSGATHATSLGSLADYRLAGSESFRTALGSLYAQNKDAMAQAGHETLQVLGQLDKLKYADYVPSGSASYPDTGMGQGLKQAAFLLKAGVGVEMACLDGGGWDTHVAQGTTVGWLTGLLDEVAKSLDAFARDMGTRMEKTTVLVQTEFGRRVAENAGLGTDHGRGGVLWAMGGGVKGGKVYGEWPGLEDLEGGDLRVTTDYRNVLAELIGAKLEPADLASVFPGLRAKPVGLFG